MMCNELRCSQWDLYFSKAALSILCFCKFTRQTIDRMVQWLIIKIQKTLYTSEFDLHFSKFVSQFGNHIKSTSQFWCTIVCYWTLERNYFSQNCKTIWIARTTKIFDVVLQLELDEKKLQRSPTYTKITIRIPN